MDNNNLNKSIDILNRQGFVDKMIKVTETLSANRKNASYAINGSWGIGKSFVLEMYENQIQKIQSEETYSDKYSLFHYNCWRYDFYEEPLVAIVASMLDQIEEKEHIIPEEIRGKCKSILKIIGNGLLSRTIDHISEKLGVDLEEVINIVKDGNEQSAKELEEKYSFDEYMPLKKTLQALKETIRSISKEKTVLFVVDELDRCLPEYAIKVLERLHHVFEDIENLQLIIAVDKEQLGNVVRNIYGEKTDVDKYLAKFIDFDLKLDEGEINDETEFNQKFEEYTNKFEYLNPATTQEDLDDFRNNIFSGIGIRSRIKIIEKCNLLHSMLVKEDNKKDYSFMCIEIAFAIMKYWGINLMAEHPETVLGNMFKNEKIDIDENNGMKYLDKILYDGPIGSMKYFAVDYEHPTNPINYVYSGDVWGAILSSYRFVSGCKNDRIVDDKYQNCGLRKYSENFRDLLYIIN